MTSLDLARTEIAYYTGEMEPEASTNAIVLSAGVFRGLDASETEETPFGDWLFAHVEQNYAGLLKIMLVTLKTADEEQVLSSRSEEERKAIARFLLIGRRVIVDMELERFMESLEQD